MNRPAPTLLIFCLLLATLTARADEFTSFDGTKIHYETSGTGRPVLLVHGFIVNSQMWKDTPLVQQLIAGGFQVIVPDLRGNGRSDRPHEAAAYTNDAEIRDLMGLMKHLNINTYDVVGYSRGAIIAARQLALDPHVRRAVLGGMGKGFTEPNWFRRWNFHAALTGQSDKHPQLKSAIEYAKKSGADTVCLARMQEFQPTTSVAELSRVKQPVLVISGDDDTDNGPAGELAALLPNATLAGTPGNHNNTARSAGFGEKILAFLLKP